MRALPLVAVVAVLTGCGAADEEAVRTTKPTPDPAPPLTFPVVAGSVPAWLERIKPLKGVGRWRSAELSPDGETLLAQWTAECEVPVAFFVPVDTRKPRPVAPLPSETVAVGWESDGRAGVFFNEGVCGAELDAPGLYLVALDGTREFVTDDLDAVASWQAERN